MSTEWLICIVLLFHVQCYKAVTNFTFGPTTIWLYADNIVRVTHLPKNAIVKPSATSIIVDYVPSDIPYNQTRDTITTKTLMIKIDDENKISFYDPSDPHNAIISEQLSTFSPFTDTVTNTETYEISQEWNFSDNDTALYGFGSYQNAFVNYRDSTIRCKEYIVETCVPFLMSSTFYGILWDNYAISTLNYKTNLITNYTLINDSNTNWLNYSLEYTSMSEQDGYHSFFLNVTEPYKYLGTYDAYYIAYYKRSMDTDYTILTEHGPSHNMPSAISLPGIYLKSGESIQVMICLQHFVFALEGGISIRGVTNKLDIHSLEANYIDYYFIYDKNQTLDGIINGYRTLTGKAPIYELKSYGFWQCQNRYHNQSEILQSAAEFRSFGVPVDNIVQVWMYWGSDENWGPQWDPTIYPYPSQMVAELHAMNFYFMVTVWSCYGSNTTFYRQMFDANQLIPPNTSYVDMYQASARNAWYDYAKQSMYDIGVDALLLDGDQPQMNGYLHNHLIDNQTISGNALINIYGLYVTAAVHDGVSADYPNKRVFCLSLCSFAGQQRYGGAYWTGDTKASWNALHRQISASINYGLSGMPYWSHDIGAFFRPNDCYTNPEYRRMLIRWFQFGAFTPIFRSEGTAETAPWYYGGTVLAAVTLIDNLRYRLLPYIYSVAYYVDQFDYTLQRALILEFPNDANVKLIEDQYMFGPNMLISPVSNDNNITNVYLPKTEQYDFYYNFWNGSTVIAGKWYNNQYVQLSQISIYIPSGSIILMAPYLKWSNEIPWTPIEVRIYRGNDAYFILFEDDGVSKDSISTNQFTEIAFIWTDATNTLTINDRKGSYDQMLTERFFNIVLVTDNHGIGVNVTQNVDKIVSYVGQKVIVNF
eukprot:497325_1